MIAAFLADFLPLAFFSFLFFFLGRAYERTMPCGCARVLPFRRADDYPHSWENHRGQATADRHSTSRHSEQGEPA